MFAPEQERYGRSLVTDLLDHGIGKPFPAQSVMPAGCTGRNGQGCVEKEYSLCCPVFEITRCGYGAAGIIGYFLVYIAQ